MLSPLLGVTQVDFVRSGGAKREEHPGRRFVASRTGVAASCQAGTATFMP